MSKASSSGQSLRRRGDSCLPCRVLKLRCDGYEPTCTQCQISGESCRYVGVLSRPRRVDVLQLRVLELEKKVRDMLSTHDRIILSHRVFEQFRNFDVFPDGAPSSTSSVTRLYPRPSPSSVSIGPGHHAPTSSVVAEEPITDLASELHRHFENWRPEEGISNEQSIFLIRMFLPRENHCCFYFSPEEVLSRSALPPSDPMALHPCFLNVMYLAVCSNKAGGLLSAHTEYFERQTRKELQSSLEYADRLEHFLWASILFGEWLAKAGRFIESYVTLVSAVRFGVACGLAGEGSDSRMLPVPETAAEAVNRINLAHALYQIDRVLAMYTDFGGSLPTGNRWGSAENAPMAQFYKALVQPYDVWPSILTREEAMSRLDPSVLDRTTISLLHERVNILTNETFGVSQSLQVISNGLNEDRLGEFQALRRQLDDFHSRMAPHPTRNELNSGGEGNPDLTKLHVIYHGTMIILYNIVVGLGELDYEVDDITLEDARRKTIEASDAIVDIARVSIPWMPDLAQYANLFLHWVSVVRVYVRELMRPSIEVSTLQIAMYCDSLSVILDIIHDTLVNYPEWKHLAAPLRNLLPTSAEDLSLSRQSGVRSAAYAIEKGGVFPNRSTNPDP